MKLGLELDSELLVLGLAKSSYAIAVLCKYGLAGVSPEGEDVGGIDDGVLLGRPSTNWMEAASGTGRGARSSCAVAGAFLGLAGLSRGRGGGLALLSCCAPGSIDNTAPSCETLPRGVPFVTRRVGRRVHRRFRL